MAVYEDILYQKADGTAKITINRPEVLNALRGQTYQELTSAFTDSADDTSVGVIVLTGTGDKAFSSGGDVRAQAQRTPDSGRTHLRTILQLGSMMRNCGKPIIAAVNGYAIGAGHELHLMCDLTVASDKAIFGQVGPRVGSVPIWGATQLLPRIVGEKRAREIVYLCKQYSAAEAETMGMVNKVVPHEDLYSAVESWCQELLDKSPRSLRIAKTVMNHGSDLDYHSYIEGIELLAQTYGDEENLEGVQAFLDKRPPNYRRFRSPSGVSQAG